MAQKGKCLWFVFIFNYFTFFFHTANANSTNALSTSISSSSTTPLNQCGSLFFSENSLVHAETSEQPLPKIFHTKWASFLKTKEWVQAYQLPLRQIFHDLEDLRILILKVQELTLSSTLQTDDMADPLSYRNQSAKSQNYLRQLKLIALPAEIQKVKKSLAFIQNNSFHLQQAFESAQDLKSLALFWSQKDFASPEVKAKAQLYFQFISIPSQALELLNLSQNKEWESIMAPITSVLQSTLKISNSRSNLKNSSSEWTLNFSNSMDLSEQEIPIWENSNNQHLFYRLSQDAGNNSDHPLVLTIFYDHVRSLAQNESLPQPSFQRRLGPFPFEVVKDQLGNPRIKASLLGDILKIDLRFQSDLTPRTLHIDWVSGQVTNPSGGRPFFKLTP